MTTYLDPKFDLTFKRVFGEHKNLCISLINSLLMFEGDQQVVEIEYQTTELIPELPILKNSIVDVRCKDKAGRQFIVEMQMHWTPDFENRVLLNASKAYVVQLDKSKDVKLLQPVYAINLVNKIFETSPELANEYYHHYKIVNIKHTNKQIKGLEFVFIELPKFRPSNRTDRRLHELWLRFLTEIDEHTTEVPEELLAEADISEAIGYMRESAFSKAEKLAYDQYKIDLITLNSIYSSLEEAKKVIEEAKEVKKKMFSEGKEKGKAEGLAEGKAEGLAEGKAEERLEIAKKLKTLGISFEQISKATNLTKEEIEKI